MRVPLSELISRRPSSQKGTTRRKKGRQREIPPDPSPMTFRTVGIEIEVANHRVLERVDKENWRIYEKTKRLIFGNLSKEEKLDSSIRGNWPVEYNSDPLVFPKEWIYQFCAALKRAGAEVNSSCGLHVHVDIIDFGPKEAAALIRLWCALEPLMFSLSGDRKKNQFCTPAGEALVEVHSMLCNGVSIREAVNLGRLDRYYAMNLLSCEAHGTVEFRLAAGTIDPEFISNWVILLREIVELAAENPNWEAPEELENGKMSSFDLLLSLISYNPELQDWVVETFEKERSKARALWIATRLERLNRELLTAIEGSNSCLAVAIINEGGDVNFQDGSPLFVAAVNGNETVVSLLLERGASVHYRHIYIAAMNGRLEIVKILVSHLRSPFYGLNEWNEEELENAGHGEIVKYLRSITEEGR